MLDRAGLAEDDISRLNIELDHDDNVWKYEIEFISGKYEYEAEVNADTGEIICYERDTDD
ncbi:MAG: PepSY domain-containing protein [Clostridia bacterium]|nr:PepSY domain-containing protein [Clostridia bacterium]